MVSANKQQIGYMYRVKFIHGVHDISLNTHILFRSICLIKKALNATELDWATS